MPSRIQRSRARGWRMPEGAIYVGRPSCWGNPFDWRMCSADAGPPAWARGAAVDLYRDWLLGRQQFHEKPPPPLSQVRVTLNGYDLCCWCPLDQPCHADILLELANG